MGVWPLWGLFLKEKMLERKRREGESRGEEPWDGRDEAVDALNFPKQAINLHVSTNPT